MRPLASRSLGCLTTRLSPTRSGNALGIPSPHATAGANPGSNNEVTLETPMNSFHDPDPAAAFCCGCDAPLTSRNAPHRDHAGRPTLCASCRDPETDLFAPLALPLALPLAMTLEPLDGEPDPAWM